MEREDTARARFWIALVAEVGLHARRFVEERERACEAGGKKVGEASSISSRLLGDDGERGALFLCLDDTEGFAVHEQQVIAGAGRERDFTKRDAASGREIHGRVILNHPARGGELRVDPLASALFWGQVRHGHHDAKLWHREMLRGLA